MFLYLPDFTAGVAQLVEHHVANVRVEGSNPFSRSTEIFGGAKIHIVIKEIPLKT